MSKTLDIRKAVRDLLLTRLENVYYRSAPADAKKPYAVFLVDETTVIDGCTVCSLLIELSDYGTDDTVIETLADNIQSDFDHFHFINSALEFSAYLDSRKNITDNDKLILRRRIEFELRVYGGN